MAPVAAAAFAALSSIGSTVAAGAGAVGSTLAAGASAAGSFFGGGSFLSTLLQGGMGIMGAMSAMRQGDDQAAALREQAADARVEAGQQRLAGLEKADEVRRSLVAEQGERDVVWGASGLDLSFGTPALARREAASDAAAALGVASANTDMTVARIDQRAANYRRQAAEAKTSGRIKAFSSLADTALSIAKRG